MQKIYVFLIIVPCLFICATAVGLDREAAEADARHGLEQVLDLWRFEDYEGLAERLEYPPERGREYFAERIVYASRKPACCWEKLQDVKATAIDQDRVVITATVGLEVDGVGTRFVTRSFDLRRIGGIWKIPMQDLLDLSEYNLQRVPNEIYERQP